MYRVGIIGSENSHAMAFSEIFNLSGAYEDIRVTCVWGEDEEASRKVSEKCGPAIVRPGDMLSQVDAVMVTSRNGALHPGYVRPFIEAKKPAFIDKPIANCAGEAAEIVALAEQLGVPVMGGSSTKLVKDALDLRSIAQSAREEGKLLGGHVYAPVSMMNEYGGFYFYSSHLAEICLTIFGYDPLAVQATRTDTGVAALLEYDRFAVALSYTDGAYRYGGTVLTLEGATTREIDISEGYALETAHFAHMLRTGETPQPTGDMVTPIRALNAIEAAYLRGGRQEIQ